MYATDSETDIQHQALALVTNLVDGNVDAAEHIFADDGLIINAVVRQLHSASSAEICIQVSIAWVLVSFESCFVSDNMDDMKLFDYCEVHCTECNTHHAIYVWFSASFEYHVSDVFHPKNTSLWFFLLMVSCHCCFLGNAIA